VVQQMIDCPFQGMTKRLYLQGKVMELMALQLAQIPVDSVSQVPAQPKPDTIAQVQYAAEILRSQLEHPPSLPELAQRVGMSNRTLQRHFRAVLGMNPFAYLAQQRMQVAKQLLHTGDRTVTEVANLVGYSHPAHFAAAFKKQFGLAPHQCLGKKLP
jgi:AraC-like DNA-binding protein